MDKYLIQTIITHDSICCDEPYYSVLASLRNNLFNRANIKNYLLFNIEETKERDKVVEEIGKTFSISFGKISEIYFEGFVIKEGYFLNSLNNDVTNYFKRKQEQEELMN